MTTTLKAIVRKPRTDGLYAVYIRIVHNRKPGYIKTNKIVDADHISKENEPTDPVVNEYCSMLVRQYTDRLNRANTTLWSVSEIIEYLLKTDEEVCFSDYSRMFIRQMRLDGHERNAKNYQLAVAHLERYMGTTRVMFGHLTAAVLKKWIESLSKTHRAKEMYPTNIRMIFRSAIADMNDDEKGIQRIKFDPWVKVQIPKSELHDFEIISLGGGRPHMDLPEYRAAAQRLEAVQEQVAAAEQDIATLEKQKKALQGNVKLLKAVEKVKPDLEAIQPEKTLTGAVKGVTVEQVKELKAAAIRGAAAEQKVQELKEENQRLQQKIPSTKEKLKEAQERQRLENQNRKLLVQVECLEQELEQERSFSDRLLDGVSAVMDFLDRHLPEKFRPLVERARELLPVPEVQQPEQEQERGHTWGGMEL